MCMRNVFLKSKSIHRQSIKLSANDEQPRKLSVREWGGHVYEIIQQSQNVLDDPFDKYRLMPANPQNKINVSSE